MPSVPSPEQAADLVHQGFGHYQGEFVGITRRAKRRFEHRDWQGGAADTRERLDLYEIMIRNVVAEVTQYLGASTKDPAFWTAMRTAHSALIVGHPAAEIAETFFNSVTRRVFRTVGINPAIEYLDFQFERVSGGGLLSAVPYRTTPVAGDSATAVRALLEGSGFRAPLLDLAHDAGLAGRSIDQAWAAGGAPLPPEAIDALDAVFFRRKGAYVVGRVRGGDRVMPLALALTHEGPGIAIDAVLCAEAELSKVFSFTRSYFNVALPRPAEAIGFLRTLMPLKPVSELYNAIGYHKHGKTEFYRELRRHLSRTTERFERAPGARGMVMEVFALPTFDAVFKVIRDTFPPNKQTTPAAVRRRYDLVFAHDRAGRLVDAQSFAGLSFPTERFSRRLLNELLESASHNVRVVDDQVVIGQLYAERRVRPLDLYIAEAGEPAALEAALDCGQAIRDLAATGIFPGDLLLKNFGVTRHGRVVFYDYDELRLLSECQFRDVPESRTLEEEVADEPWYYVGPDDIFPEELGRFALFTGPLRAAFLAAHGCIYDPGFWRDLQARQAAGDVVDIYPYGADRRLSP